MTNSPGGHLFENKVKKLLAAGKPAWGAAVFEPSILMTKLSVSTGIDFLWIDTEHAPFGTESIAMLPVVCRMGSCMPLVRVAGLDSSLIKKALDIGASAIMVPQINNAQEARKAVQFAKYPPKGTRGVSPIWTLYMDVPWEDYLPRANEEVCVVVQVETPKGINNVEAIAAVEGVDVVFAGPTDLSASLGCIGQVEHPTVQKFLEQFPQRVAKSGKSSGIAVDGVEQSKKAFDRGYRFINIGHILSQGTIGLTSDLSEVRTYSDRFLSTRSVHSTRHSKTGLRSVVRGKL
jgi:4-hydroxy-2-oxoheptanedioate aldolase